MAERAGYTVTLFLVDVSPSMGEMRELELADERIIELTNLEWSLQYIKLKIQEMIFNGRKTDQCGVILFGTQETDNIINERDGGYEHVRDFIPIGQPNAGTLAKLSTLSPSTEIGDPVDAIIVGIETQDRYLSKKKTWTRKIVLLTDGQNPIEVEDWEATANKMNDLGVSLTIVGIDFDDEAMPFEEENKSNIKRANEEFFYKFTNVLDNGLVGNCEFALEEAVRPDIKQVKSALIGHELRIGDTENYPDEATKLQVKASKCTALARPKSWKRFAKKILKRDGDIIMRTQKDMEDDDEAKVLFAELSRRTDYYLRKKDEEEEDEQAAAAEEEDDRDSKEEPPKNQSERIDKEDLIRGFKYGASFVPCPDGSFPRLVTKKGIDICGFFRADHFRREQAIGEVQYLWADPASPANQVALSSIVGAMAKKNAMAIARWVSKDGMDPKMGVLKPTEFENVDCLLWVQMPFADDVRKYTFASLDTLISNKGETITKHPYLPTDGQQDAMDKFVDSMDLMEAGERNEDGHRNQWFDTRLSYNPAIHRTKQAQFHGAVVTDLNTHPLPPPHWELLKYFESPRRVLKRAHSAINECKTSFNVKAVPKRVIRARKDGHVTATEDDEMLLLDQIPKPATKLSSQPARSQAFSQRKSTISPASTKRWSPKRIHSDSDTESDGEAEKGLVLDHKSVSTGISKPVKSQRGEDVLMTPARSVSPGSQQQEADSSRHPGRIIGLTDPLGDYTKNTEKGDIVTKAMQDLGWAITQIVMRPFARRRTQEMLECMKSMRVAAIVEDEISVWNDFLQNLRHVCVEEVPGNKDFWSHVQKFGRNISLISSNETTSKGGQGQAVTEDRAVKFIES